MLPSLTYSNFLSDAYTSHHIPSNSFLSFFKESFLSRGKSHNSLSNIVSLTFEIRNPLSSLDHLRALGFWKAELVRDLYFSLALPYFSHNVAVPLSHCGGEWNCGWRCRDWWVGSKTEEKHDLIF